MTHWVKDLVSRAFAVAGLTWRDHAVCDTTFIRPAEPENLCADAAKAKQNLGWSPVVTFDQLVTMMVESGLELLSRADAEIYRIPDLEIPRPTIPGDEGPVVGPFRDGGRISRRGE